MIFSTSNKTKTQVKELFPSASQSEQKFFVAESDVESTSVSDFEEHSHSDASRTDSPSADQLSQAFDGENLEVFVEIPLSKQEGGEPCKEDVQKQHTLLVEEDKERNVRLILIFVALQSLFESIARLSLLDSFVYLISGDSSKTLGWSSSMPGLMGALCAFPVGYVCDRYRRSSLLGWKGATSLGLICVALSATGVALQNLAIILVAQALIGVWNNLVNTCLASLFADSIAKERRTELFSRKEFVYQLFSLAGPLLALVGFLLTSNEWEAGQLKYILVIANVGLLVPNVLLVYWKDVKASPEDEETDEEEDDFVINNNNKKKIFIIEDVEAGFSSSVESITPSTNGSCTTKRLRMRGKLRQMRSLVYRSSVVVPLLLTVSSFISQTAAGLSSTFFVTYFMEDFELTPVAVQGVYAGYSISICACVVLASFLSLRMGRAWLSFFFDLLAAASFFVLGFTDNLVLVILFFLLRGSFTMGLAAIDQSLLMDFSPLKQRGFWNSMQFLSFVFSSAAGIAGGYMKSDFDYRSLFLISAIIYVLAVVVKIPLLKLVPKSSD